MSVVGIKETKEAVQFACELIAKVRVAAADGVGLGDVVLLPSLAMGAIKAVKGGDQIPKELGDLQAGEFDELVAVAKGCIEGLTPDEYEEAVWVSLALIKMFVVKD